jgi:deoxycytidylate deaminase
MVEWNPDIKIVSPEEATQHIPFLREAYRAAYDSHDLVTHTGAVIVRNGLIISRGYNHFQGEAKKEVDANPALLTDPAHKEWKNKNITHAERSAIQNARGNGDLSDTIKYMPWVPCRDCADDVLKASITKMYGHKELIMKTPERWWKSCDEAISILRKEDVDLYMIEGRIGGVEHLFNGELWYP